MQKISPKTKIFAVLKANAYGHDAIVCAHALDAADAFAVVVPNEAIALREAGIEKSLLVLQGASDFEEIEKAILYDLSLVVHCDEQLEMLEQVGLTAGQSLTIWIKLDTGMGRLGFRADRMPELKKALTRIEGIKVQGCMTHFSSADETNNSHTVVQIDNFYRAVSNFEGQLSLANSAGLIAWPQSRYGWVRPGIMLYGANPLWPDYPLDLKPVMTVRAPVIAVRAMKKGQTIGYGNRFICQHDLSVAVIAIGYGDGYPRHISSKTCALLNGKRCVIVGRVSMDSLVVRLADSTGARLGDLATLWGDGLPVEEIAVNAGTLSYELLCQIRGNYVHTESTDVEN